MGEVFGPQGLLGDHAQAQAVGQGAQGFHEVAGQGLAAVADLVVVANAGVVAGDVQGHGHFGGDEGVGEREQGVKGVARGAAVAFLKVQAGGYYGPQAGKVGGSGGPFHAAQAV